MQRREFIILLSGAAITRPAATRAQQPMTPVIGYLSRPDIPRILSTHLGSIPPRSEGDRLHRGSKRSNRVSLGPGSIRSTPVLATELVSRKPSVIVTVGGSASALAAKAATAATTIPIVFVTGIDPVQIGLVQSLSRPGSNSTGVTLYTAELAAKRLQMLRELAPTADVIALLVNPRNPNNSAGQVSEAHNAGTSKGQSLLIVRASSDRGNERHGETVTPPRNRKSGNGNPSPTAKRATILPDQKLRSVSGSAPCRRESFSRSTSCRESEDTHDLYRTMLPASTGHGTLHLK
jgi:putative ABC transport system substrate-binding protein